jgi:flagellar hook-length control protein FliK
MVAGSALAGMAATATTTTRLGGWAGTRGEVTGADPSAAGSGAASGAVSGAGSSALDAAAGGARGKGLASDVSALADVPGQSGAVALDASFQAVPGQESFAAQLAAQATASPGAPLADPGAATSAGRAAEAQIDTPVDAPGFGEAVMHKVVHLARDGAQEIKLHLNPIEMGPIQIRIAIESGQARIEFGAAAEATRQALENAMPALAESLQADGLNLAAGSGVAASADPTLAGLNGQPPGGASAQGGGGQGQRGGAGDLRGSSGASGGSGPSDGAGRSDVRAPVGHELRTGWAGTPAASNGALRALDLYA